MYQCTPFHQLTEVGYHGRDVDTIVRDLVEAALALVKERAKARAQEDIKKVRGPNETYVLLHT